MSDKTEQNQMTDETTKQEETGSQDQGQQQDQGKQKQTKQERRQERQAQNQRGNESENQAPASLFAKNSKKDATVTEDPVAVKIIKEQIDEYVAKAGKGSGETKEAQMATRALHKAIRNLVKLRGASLKQAFSHLYKAINSNETGAFSVPYPFRWGHDITGEVERSSYTSFMNLMLQYAKLQNPSYIHERVDVQRSLAFIKDTETRSDMLKQFASK